MSVATLAYTRTKDRHVGYGLGSCWCVLVSNGSVAQQYWLKDSQGNWLIEPTKVRDAKAIAGAIVKLWKDAPTRVTWKTEGKVFRVRW